MAGITNYYRTTQEKTIESSADLETIGLDVAIAAGQSKNLRYWIPFIVGNSGGVRAKVVAPDGADVVTVSYSLIKNGTAAPVANIVDNIGSTLSNALAGGATCLLLIEAAVRAGDTGGVVSLQMAQNTVDVEPLSVLEGSFLADTAF